MRTPVILILTLLLFVSCGNNDKPAAVAPEVAEELNEVEVHPVYHGSIVFTRGHQTFFVDPFNGAERYTKFGAPDIIFITHTHPDHLDPTTLDGIDLSKAQLIAPTAVMEALTNDGFLAKHTLNYGERYKWDDIIIDAVPAYNPPPKDDRHPKGKFNGYVIDFDGERYYVSGDTEGVPEMRELEDIDVAFVCMNLPYTMDVQQAADAVLDFKPNVVYPYHYRNQDKTYSDLELFQKLVNDENENIEVRLENWYPES